MKNHGRRHRRPPRAKTESSRPRYLMADLLAYVRRRMGLPEYTLDRMALQELLHPEEDVREALRREDEMRLRQALLCVLAGFLLMALAVFSASREYYTAIPRPGYGEAPEERVLNLELGETPYEIPLTVESRKYSPRQWEKLREQVWKAVKERALGENPDWEHIRTDLNLAEETGVPGIDIQWETSDPERIDYDGVLGEEAADHSGESVVLTAVIRSEEEWWEQSVTAVLDTVPQSEEERIRRVLSLRLKEAASDREEAEIALPTESFGQTIRYPKDTMPTGWIPLLGVMAAAACLGLPTRRKREAKVRRERELQQSYPEMVSTLTVLMEAGLTIRGAWERMVMQYRRSRRAGGGKRILYEEMLLSWNSLSQGAREERIYAEFGRRCGLQPYLRLGSLLESNLRKGSRGLLPLLREEAEQALEERLRAVRKQGEETSSRMLLPMLMLFALVLVILMAPAMMSL